MLSVHSPTKSVAEGRVRLAAAVDSEDGCRTLWFSLPEAFADHVDPACLDPFVITLLFEASRNGQDLTVKGRMSTRLFYNFSHGYAYLLSRLTEDSKIIRLLPSDLGDRSGSAGGDHVATGFSAGIDSFQTFIDHNVDPAIEGYRISHFLLNDVGSHGASMTAAEVFTDRRRRVARFANEMGIPLIDIQSNMADFFCGTPFQLTHTLRNVAAATLLQGYIGKFLYSSSFKYDECFVGPTYDVGYSEPYALHLLSTDDLTCISSGSRYSRLEKTINISQFEPTYRYLDVCVDPAAGGDKPNCSRCWKCSRALLTFEALGVLDRYHEVFDLDVFRAHRDRYIATTLHDMSRKNPNDADVLQFSRDRLINPPSAAKIIALRSRQKLASLRR